MPLPWLFAWIVFVDFEPIIVREFGDAVRFTLGECARTCPQVTPSLLDFGKQGEMLALRFRRIT